MAELDSDSIDLILADLPYGTTDCAWDHVIDPARLWEAYRRLLKPNGTVVLMATQPFTTELINSNRAWFRYHWVWKKNMVTGYASAKRRPLKTFEEVLVFSPRAPAYYPIGVRPLPKPVVKKNVGHTESIKGDGFYAGYKQTLTGYPRNILEVDCERGHHPTQKPVPLMSYLIRTYTQPGQTVLDNTMGSGSTGVAAVECGRAFIGIERDPAYFERASRRIAAASPTT
jgi:site-specific DNA-methyltransferase (adenine-specific)